MIIYSNGCSHTKTADFFFSHGYFDIVAKELFNSDYNIHDLNENKEFINKSFDSKNIVFKQSECGKSNDLIFYETINFIYSVLNTNLKPNLLLIQWSGPNRRFHTDFDGNIINVNPHDNSELGIKFEPLASIQSLQFMILLQDVCNLYNIDYIFIPYMELDKESCQNNELVKKLNTSKYTTSIFEGHRNSFRKNGMSMDLQGHPNFYGIYFLSKKILDILGYSIQPIEKYIEPRDIVLSKHEKENFIKKYSNELGDAVINSVKKLKDLI